MMSRNCPDIEDDTIETDSRVQQDDMNLEDCVNVEDGVDVGDGINNIFSSSSGVFEPFVGNEFDEVEDAQAFYKAYARRTEYVCSREGFRRESWKQIERKILEPAETKIGCKATMCIKKDCKKWTVCKFVREHNHELLIPRSTSLLRGHRGITRVQKKLILTLNESGGDFNIGCIDKDVENYLENKRRKLFEEGDAQRLYAYFLNRQCKKSEFVYSMQVDENGWMGSCFWADARSRVVYQYFGDVVTFDATYLTNIYNMPFVPFSRVNHHHQTVMFGCALLWVPAYLRTTFCAGMSTTQRSESMNKFFKNYVRSSTIVSDFVHQYEKVLDARYFKEKEKDVQTKSTRAVMKNLWKIEADATSIYTRKSFIIYQDELFNSQWYIPTKVGKEGERRIYGVTLNGKEQPIYHVTLESGDAKAICTCHMFEFVGILCRHILCVLKKKSKLNMLPHHYILERWTINAKSRAILDIPNSDGYVMTHDDPMMRKNKLRMQFYDIAELGSQSPQKYNHLSLALDKVHKELLFMEDIEGKKI
ncbi:hypothetical protein I3842_01G169800 [Carya illinoinensis]|uniref:Protein FAR1-RELATED SEQUENCE n=1 Tax=Carya illinoinensis TaxID=32201 RepID=A0A922K651_CARIL|nr:hypothetical protein I3842_01G169800 [Carya illinoinensis]